ncbi:hypothetical protein OH76DRAFT_1486675 [Lentinus brumalis]|uniref:Uncharacterized protein n=1 Tax=Lentinus brumalis TaxID=2498619 RepID=A0A371CXE0_9APHY|nr:hypothetical protein OH76DRAFT_1486675 [Polyporus brumalis]
MRFPSTDIPDVEYTDGTTLQGAQPADTEAVAVEEGEFYEEATPPSNQRWAIERRTHESTDQRDDSSNGRHAPPSHQPAPSQRKRHWGGSQGSEERSRPTRRPRWDEASPELRPMRLPSIAELLSNPWDGSGPPGGEQNGIQPVATSTPKPALRATTGDDRSQHSIYVMDSQGNASGKPPTPFSRANTTPGAARHAVLPEYERKADRMSRTADWAARANDGNMWVDEDDVDSSALLQPLSSQKSKHLRGRNHDLGETLADPPSPQPRHDRFSEDVDRRGGRAPSFWNDGAPAPDGRNRASAADDWEADADRSAANATFFPIPNTKAWQHQQEARRARATQARGWDGAPATRDAAQVRAGDQGTQDYNTRERVAREHAAEMHDDSRMSSTTSPHAYARALSGVPGYERQGRATSTGWNEDAVDDVPMHNADDWRDYEMLPTAVAQGPRGEGAPTLAANPRDGRWTVHFDDPERLICGQSGDWQRRMWQDPSAVIFTAYNYRYTPHGVVNRHVEAAVTAIVKYVTRETKFYVVPPHPDPKRKLSVRDLPFSWGIRGLSKEGAARMTSIRIASSLGVSIVTYPRRLGNPRWVCSLVGFLRPDTQVIKAAVLEVLQEPAMYAWIERMVRDSRSLRSIPREERTEYILNTLEVRIASLDDGDDFMANVYLEPPTDDMAEFRTWVAALRGEEFNNFTNGTGTARKIYYCGGCRGVDHDTMQCPLPEMDGWQGTRQGAQSHTAEFLDTKKDASRGTRGGNARGGGASGGQTRGGRQGDGAENRFDKNGWGAPGRGGGWRTHAQAGRSPWAGGYQQQHPSRRHQTPQWSDESRGDWRN